VAAGLGLVSVDDVDAVAVESGLEGGGEGEAHFGGVGWSGFVGVEKGLCEDRRGGRAGRYAGRQEQINCPWSVQRELEKDRYAGAGQLSSSP
jgi:hypothetical protein